MRKLSLTLTLLTTVTMVGCRFPSGLPTLNQPGQGVVEGSAVRKPAPPLSGRVTFAQRSTLTSLADVAGGATVSLINTGTNQTVSTALTNANGDFVLTFSNGYVADPTATYFLEALKGLNANQPGSHAVRVRTIAKYSAGWTSITSATPGGGTVISPSTTALAIGAGLVNGAPDAFDFSSLIGAVTGGDTPAYQPVSGLSADDHAALLGLVESILSDGQDPIANVGRTQDGAQTHWTRLNVAPSVTSFTPAQAKIAAGVSVSGTGFSPIAAGNVLKFNGETAVPTSATVTGLTTSVPAGATSGPTSLQVGNLSVLGPNFSVLPEISDFTPRKGAPGTLVTLTGTGFDGKIRTNNLIEFNGVAGTIKTATATRLQVEVPAGATNGPITVTVNGQPITTGEAFAAAYAIRTVAGALAPKTVAATEWQVRYTDTALDSAGNLYAAAPDQNAVYRISPDGTLSTVAGNGGAGFTGDGKAATAAALDAPEAIALDAQGNLYIADTNNCVIRKVDKATGIISTVAGNGRYGSAGEGGAAITTSLAIPSGIAVDAAGDLYIAERQNNRIRKVSNGTLTTVTTTPSNPYDVAVDAEGNLYIAEPFSNAVRKLTKATGTLSIAAGTTGLGFNFGDFGPATSLSLSSPMGVSLDAAGNLYIAESSGSRVRKVDTTGHMTTVAGQFGNPGFEGDGGAATAARLNGPRAVAADAAGNVYIADTGNNRIRKVSNGTIETVAGRLTEAGALAGGSALSVLLGNPSSVAEAPNGDLYITDSSLNTVWKLSNGALSPLNTGAYTLKYPLGVTVAASGDIYIADTQNDRILLVSGETTTIAAGSNEGIARPHSLALDAAGNLYIANTNKDQILKRGADGTIATVNAGSLNRPNGIALDASGNLYIADYYNNRIVKVDTTSGAIATVAGNGNENYSGDGGLAIHASLDNPRGVAVDQDGNLYVVDTDNQRIRKVDATTGTISTVVGSGTEGYSGDGGLAILGQLRYPRCVTVGASGNLYIADSDNRVVRSVGF
ncbi:MAG TPA: SMP-30/gluconolactonase/LRE family protein [Pantanalinema sp.]